MNTRRFDGGEELTVTLLISLKTRTCHLTWVSSVSELYPVSQTTDVRTFPRATLEAAACQYEAERRGKGHVHMPVAACTGGLMNCERGRRGRHTEVP
jgi:hypothetical protein